VIGDNAPDAIKEHEIKNYFGRKVAIDASMSLYQFLIAVRSEGQQLTNEAGEITRSDPPSLLLLHPTRTPLFHIFLPCGTCPKIERRRRNFF